MHRGELGEKDVVITIDDGFYGVAALAIPILEELGLTATIYVTSYYMQRNNPIFRIALQYIFWKTSTDLDCSDWLADVKEPHPTKGPLGDSILWRLIEYGETALDETGRMALAREIAGRLELDFDEIAASRKLTLMTEAEVANLANRGFDIQLHTHRHRMPTDPTEAKRELDDNRSALQPLSPRPLKHFCYPSGIWSRELWPLMFAEQVETATTCEPGLNYSDTPPLGLKRFLDSQTMPQIVFEAEVNGFAEILRRYRRARN